MGEMTGEELKKGATERIRKMRKALEEIKKRATKGTKLAKNALKKQ